MKDYLALQKICLSEVMAVGIRPAENITWKINRRAKTRWGLCSKKNGFFEIQIAAVLLEDDRISEKDCKTTMIHEILHTCDGCMKHTGYWKHYAELMNLTYGYDIKRITTGEEKGVENYKSTPSSYKYAFACRRCHRAILRKRICTFTKYYRNYTCPYCGMPRAFVKVDIRNCR